MTRGQVDAGRGLWQAVGPMSCAIGPNGFHDGEPPSEDDYDEDALSKLCDNPAYLVVGADDDLVGNLPDWVDDLLREHEALAEQVEKLGLEPTHYVSLPERGSNRELRDFLDELGFTVNSGYVERGPLSSIDGVVYVRASKVPALEKRAARELLKAKQAIIKDARKALKLTRVKVGEVDGELARLVSVAQLGDPEYRAKLAQLEDFEETEANLREHVKETDEELQYWRRRAQTAEHNQEGERYRHLKSIDEALAQSDRYAAWTWAVAAEFGITIQGPVLTLPDRRSVAIEAIFGQELKSADPGAWAVLNRRAPAVTWIRVGNLIRRGMSSASPLSWVEALDFFDRRLTWNQVWWVVLGRQHARYPVRIYRYLAKNKPDGSIGGFDEAPVLPDGWFGFTAEQTARWDQLLKDYWGNGLQVAKRFPLPKP